MEKIRVNIVAGADGPGTSLMERAAVLTFAQFDFSFLAQADIALADEAEIREINREYREVDRVTDVLSFPMAAFDQGQPLEELFADPETGRVFLGDILLCMPRAVQQAEEYGHSVERECAYLIVHSMLHLLGFDHEDEGEKAVMRAREEAVMEQLNLGRLG